MLVTAHADGDGGGRHTATNTISYKAHLHFDEEGERGVRVMANRKSCPYMRMRREQLRAKEHHQQQNTCGWGGSTPSTTACITILDGSRREAGRRPAEGRPKADRRPQQLTPTSAPPLHTAKHAEEERSQQHASVCVYKKPHQRVGGSNRTRGVRKCIMRVSWAQ